MKLPVLPMKVSQDLMKLLELLMMLLGAGGHGVVMPVPSAIILTCHFVKYAVHQERPREVDCPAKLLRGKINHLLIRTLKVMLSFFLLMVNKQRIVHTVISEHKIS